MRTAIGVDISAVKDMLAALDGKVKERAIRAALKAGAQVEQREVQANCPERLPGPSGTALPVGALRSDVIIRMSKQKAVRPYALVKFGKYTAHVARFVADGHKIHYGGSHAHGKDTGKSTTPNPFVSRAFEAALVEVQQTVQAKLVERITKADAARTAETE